MSSKPELYKIILIEFILKKEKLKKCLIYILFKKIKVTNKYFYKV